ncbi:ScpA family protein [Shewanella loihica]|uniref:Segregation and condensation protein A n=1 Tax=Shewanella loihica (strain ATCC BAA-1088 / PV-4) TaxID=323850 RepID=A3QF66_SHELP|nr:MULTISPECIES: ScpA family protein [Shewanella]ABO24114.1 condensin subunit ScpA [Shewanella loihica PV-4]QYJ91580.1 segregation/condensation protein A [Shewanella halotolerans]QYJ92317.1 segregation/condensation protein A [Shewanella spartinae]QYJ96184.1 segregation/condensation protein A [Shewanella alkalitolerans]TVP12718.1 segregation and condensation protein A [Shewanella sp. KCT]
MQGTQQSLPLAVVRGEPVKELPADLFIPPEALEVFLESFEGPLDLLLYLIRKQKLDVVEMAIAPVTDQYLEYIELLQGARVELAADYLVMAATLAEIKSRLLLPRPELAEEDEADPRAQLIRQLKAYEVIKDAQQRLDALPRLERDVFQAKVLPAPDIKPVLVPPSVSLVELAGAFAAVLKRVEATEHHHVQREHLSTRERMTQILAMLEGKSYVPFEQLFDVSEGRAGVVVSFLALMELVKELLVDLIQAQPLSTIHVRAY